VRGASLHIEAPPSGWGLVFIGYAIETPRAEAPLHAVSTPDVGAVLAAEYGNDVGESNEAMARTPAVPKSKDPRLGLQRTSCVRSERRSGQKPPMGARSKPRPMGGNASLSARKMLSVWPFLRRHHRNVRPLFFKGLSCYKECREQMS
jgi:hypothetical protein